MDILPDQEDRGKIKCLVIQLTGAGEVFQSLMALRATKQSYQNIEIHFVTRQMYAKCVQRVPWIEKIYIIPDQDWHAQIQNGESNVSTLLPKAAQWITPIITTHWDFIVNWSLDEAASYLTALLPARNKLGFTRGLDGSLASSDDWSCYIRGAVLQACPQNIHLTDIFTTQFLTALQIQYGPPELKYANESVTSRLFFSIKPTSSSEEWRRKLLGKKWIGLQLGGDLSRNHWPISQWKKLVEFLVSNHPDYSIVILGENDQQEIARELLVSDRVLSLVGKMEFDLWVSVISNCEWVITPNDAAIHLASVHGTRVLQIILDQSKWQESGPYGNGHYGVASLLGDAPTAESVYGTWSYAIQDWRASKQRSVYDHFAQLKWGLCLKNSRILKSRIRTSQEGGGVVYENILDSRLTISEWCAIVTGQIARSWYCGWSAPLGQGIKRNMISPQLIVELRKGDQESKQLMRICMDAARLSEELSGMTKRLKSDRIMPVALRQQVAHIGLSLNEIDTMIEKVCQSHVHLTFFWKMLRVNMHNLSGSSLSDISHESALAYRRMIDGVKIYRKWLQWTVRLARPVSVRSSLELV